MAELVTTSTVELTLTPQDLPAPTATQPLAAGEIPFSGPFPTAPVAGFPVPTPADTAHPEPAAQATLAPDTPQLYAVRFVDAQVAYGVTWPKEDAAGKPVTGSFQVLKTTDGGQTWANITPLGAPGGELDSIVKGDSPGMEELWLVSHMASTAAKRKDTIYYSPNGGRSWKKFIVPFDSGFVTMTGPGAGWAQVNGGGGAGHWYEILYQTTDSGATWKLYKPRPPLEADNALLPDAIRLNASSGISFPTLYSIWVGGGETDVSPPELLVSRDSGQTWQPLSFRLPGDMFPAYLARPVFLTDPDGYLAMTVTLGGPPKYYDGEPYWLAIFVTQDGGSNWSPRPLLQTNNRSGFQSALVQFVTPTDWFAYCQGRLCRTSDAGQTWQSYPLDFYHALVTDPGSPSFTFVDPQNGWMAIQVNTPDGRWFQQIYKTSDGGKTWEKINPVLK